MLINRFYDFLQSEDTLQVYEQGEMIYSSRILHLLPWLEYIKLFSPLVFRPAAFEKITGNASALMAVKSGCRKVYSAAGTSLAARTLARCHISYQFIRTISAIDPDIGDEARFLETLSIGKNPNEFYDLVRCHSFRELQKSGSDSIPGGLNLANRKDKAFFNI